jgi:hypothetical protein
MKTNSNIIFINPFSSDSLKDLPVELVLRLSKYLITEHNFKIYISKGIENKKDILWYKNLDEKLELEKERITRHIKVVDDFNLSDLAKQLYNFKIVSALTADSGISHLLSRMLIPNITIYNKQFWDAESPQSLSAESPLGFCRYYLPQFPSIFMGDLNLIETSKFLSLGLLAISKGFLTDNNETMMKDLLLFKKKILKFLGNYSAISYQTHLSLYYEFLELKNQYKNNENIWSFYIYNPDELIRKISNKPRHLTAPLIYSAWKISPIHKMLEFK